VVSIHSELQVFFGDVAMIGRTGQFKVLTDGSEEEIRSEVWRLFGGFGGEGGYILSVFGRFLIPPSKI
jgi:hypothetical protein